MPEITLEQLLRSRDERAAFQRVLIESYKLPLVSFTVNMPGPVKRESRSETVFRAGVSAIRERLAGGYILYSKLREPDTGYEGYFVCDMPELKLKSMMCGIEDAHALGRLMDIDVLGADRRIIGRAELGTAPRACLVCGKPAAACVRSQAHTPAELSAAIDRILAGAKG